MLTEKDYCDYDTCVALKELGYKGISRFFYATKESPLRRYSYDQILTTRIADAVGHTLAISLYVAQKWLRERHNLHITIFSQSQESWQYRITKPHQKLEDGLLGEDFSSYEDALSEGLHESIKILQDEQKENN